MATNVAVMPVLGCGAVLSSAPSAVRVYAYMCGCACMEGVVLCDGVST